MHLANRVGIMDQGRIVQVGSPSEIYENPDNLFVAEFVGRLNKLHATFQGRDDGVALIQVSENLRMRSEDIVRLSKNQPVVAVIRPEHVQVFPKGSGDPRALIGTVKFANFLGSQITYTLTLPDGHDVQADTQNTRHARTFKAAIGDTVDVVMPARDIKLFKDDSA